MGAALGDFRTVLHQTVFVISMTATPLGVLHMLAYRLRVWRGVGSGDCCGQQHDTPSWVLRIWHTVFLFGIVLDQVVVAAVIHLDGAPSIFEAAFI